MAAINGHSSSSSGSWLQVEADSHFSLQNIPFAIVSHAGSNGKKVVASRIGEHVIDLAVLEKSGLLSDAFGEKNTEYFSQSTLNSYAAIKRSTQKAVRLAIQSLFQSDNSKLKDDAELVSKAVLPIDQATCYDPFHCGTFVDYSVFMNHGLNAGRALFGPDTPLPPSFATNPMAYNGRASTVSIRTEIIRPQGQCRILAPPPVKMVIGPSQAMDHEFEFGAFIGHETEVGTYLEPKDGTDYIFGLVLLNDWSARDIQAFEMNPLGPFNSKSAATSISPWVVTMDALESFRVPLRERLSEFTWGEPDYLKLPSDFLGAIDIDVETRIQLAEEASGPERKISACNFSLGYWSFEQMLGHYTYCGAPLRTGDLIGSGTISGPVTPGSNGCFLELSTGGKVPLTIEGTEYKRCWVEDHDTIILEACAGKKDYARVGFGALKTKLLPAQKLVKAPSCA